MESANGLEMSLLNILENRVKCSTSPGSNPFDDVAKTAASFLVETPAEDLKISFKEETSYSFNNLVKSFQNLHLSQDNVSPFKGPLGDFEIGRESIPFNLAVTQFEDAGRLSENINSLSIEYGRESLGILNISTVRESLTLLDLPVCTLDTMLNASCNLKVEQRTFSNNTPGTLDTAFLITDSSNESFCNSLSFKQSRRFDVDKASPVIYSVQSPRLKSNVKWTSNIHPLYMSPKPNDSNFSAELERLRLRIKSMSNINDNRNKRNIGEFWSVEKPERKSSMRMSFSSQLSFSENNQSISDEDNNFNDSVFLEANHIAEKISRCSQEELECRDNDNNLDNTLPPELVDDDTEESKNDKISQKPSAETIFKTIDKMVTPFYNLGDQKLKLRKISNVTKNDSQENKNNRVDIKEKDQNVPERPSSKDNLSNILSSGNVNEEQNFINNFYAPSCLNRRINFKSNNSLDLEDSGHSSIVEPDAIVQEQNDKHDCYEVLDLRVSKNDESNEIKTSVSQTNILPLDLSMKSKINNPVNKRMSQSFTFASPKVKVLPDKFSSNYSAKSSISSLDNSKFSKTSSISLSSNDSKRNSSQTSLPALKLKRTEERTCKLKKGPLKAVVPIIGTNHQKSNTKESNSIMTTPKKLRRTLSLMPRTSSPIIESKLKPVAQSTPDGSSGRLKSNSFSIYGRTPESKSTPSGQSSISNKINSKKIQTLPLSGNTPKSSIKKPSSVPSQYGKRFSVTEQKEANNLGERRRRSFSANKETGILSVINKVRENIVNSPYYKTNILSEGNDGQGLDKNLKSDSKLPLSNAKSKIGKLIIKPKPGKENVIC